MMTKRNDALMDIAIIGMAIRVPGADNYNNFWQNLILEKESIAQLPSLSEKNSQDGSRFYVPKKGILQNIDYFEPQLFNISPADARLMDPQTRIFLELVWEALEDSGYYCERQLGTVSVIASQGNIDTYVEKNILLNANITNEQSEFQKTINHGSDFLATRVAYAFDFTGVSYNLQAGCSSSLVAVAQGCELIKSGLCDAAITGGINIALPALGGYFYEKGMILSKSGTCRPFDANADGTVPGNGGGVVILKPLKKALMCKDNIHAVIKGYGMNNDGKNKVSFAAPSIQGQKKAIIAAMKMARIKPQAIDFIEAHGTGTLTGDPIEISAINSAYTEIDPKIEQAPITLALGSLKGNIGHLYAGAGIAGLIKCILALKKGVYPGTLGFNQINPLCKVKNVDIKISNKKIQLSRKKFLNGAVSSFGVGGTNLHVILKKHVNTNQTQNNINNKIYVATLSARTNESLRQYAKNIVDYLVDEDHSNLTLQDIIYTLQVGRQNLVCRKASLIKNINEFKQWLLAVASSETTPVPRTNKLAFYISSKLYLNQQDIVTLCATFSLFASFFEHYKAEVSRLFSINLLAEEGDVLTSKLLALVFQLSWFQCLNKMSIAISYCEIDEESLYTAGIISHTFSFEEGVTLLVAYHQSKQSIQNEIRYHSLVKIIPKKTPTLIWIFKNNIIQSHSILNDSFWLNQEVASLTATKITLKKIGLANICNDISHYAEPSYIGFIDQLKSLWECGYTVDWSYLYSVLPSRVSLPTYVFNKSRYWIDIEEDSRCIAKQSNANQTILAENKIEHAQESNLTKIKRVFISCLQLDKIAEDESFFSLGGDSILAIELLCTIQKLFGLEIEYKDLINNDTPKKLSLFLENKFPQIITGVVNQLEKRSDTIIKNNNQATYLASPIQRSFWFLEATQLANFSAYNVPIAFSFKGCIDKNIWKRSIDYIIQKHDVMRSQFEFNDGKLAVIISNPKDYFYELNLTRDEGYAWIKRNAGRPFNLKSNTLFCIVQINFTADEGIIFFNFHHCIMDGRSLDILLNDFTSCYNFLEQGLNPTSCIQSRSYYDISNEYNDWLNTDVFTQQLTYWQTKLAGYTPVLLPTDYVRRQRISFQGKIYSTTVDASLFAAIKEFAKTNFMSLYMVLIGFFYLMLRKLTNANDIVIGTTIDDRKISNQNIVGPFINTLPIRISPNTITYAEEFFQLIKTICREAFEHQHVPFEKIVSAIDINRDDQQNPLYNVMLNVQNQNDKYKLHLTKMKTEQIEQVYSLAQLDLLFNCKFFDDTMSISIEYRHDLFRESSIINMLDTYLNLMIEVCSKKRSDISAITSCDFLSLIYKPTKWRKPAIYFFLLHACKQPKNTALIVSGKAITYEELNTKSNQLANYLSKLSNNKNENCVICLKRTEWLIITLLAAMKLNWSYTPIDDSYPIARICQFLDEANPLVALIENDTNLLQHLSQKKVAVLPLTKVIDQVVKEKIVFTREIDYLESDHVYRIFTSGSTGKPKLVGVQQANVFNLLTFFKHKLSINQNTRFLSITSISFDIFFLEFMLPLFSGGVILLENGLNNHIDPQSLANKIIKLKPTLLQATPSTWECLLQYLQRLANEPIILVGGEAVKLATANKLLSISKNVYNVYGPTETTVWSTIYKVKRVNKISIGRPIKNTILLIVSDKNRILPVGEVGEIYIGGEGVSAGYLHDPELTNKSFVSAEHIAMSNIKMSFYRTGDLGYYDKKGYFYFIGRIDSVIKLRGYRINTKEIASYLDTHPMIHSSEVQKKIINGREVLIAYYICNSENIELKHEELYNYLTRNFPRFMLPSYFMAIKQWPLTINYKLDLLALPLPDYQIKNDEKNILTIEENILNLFQAFLRDYSLAKEDNFFIRGVTSIDTMQLHKKLVESGFQCDIIDLFHCPTVSQLSKFLTNKNNFTESKMTKKDKSNHRLMNRKIKLINSKTSDATN